MGISSIDFIVADFCRKYYSVPEPEAVSGHVIQLTQNDISEAVGISAGMVASSIATLRTLSLMEDESYHVTGQWFRLVEFCHKDTASDLDMLWNAFYDFWNEKAEVYSFGKLGKRDGGNKKKFKDVVKRCDEDITIKQLELVLVYLAEVWAGDEKMVQYIRISTIFGSKQKFEKYLEDARTFVRLKEARA